MATLTEQQIREKADEWADCVRRVGVEKGILDHRMAPVMQRAEELEAEIKNWLEVAGKPAKIAGEKAVAEYAINKKFGSRQIDVKKFFVAAAGKGDATYECVTVEVKKAEELLGKATVDEISERPEIETKRFSLVLKK